MTTEKEKISVDDYIDERFPKGEDKRRGEVLVVNALAQIKAKAEIIKQVIEFIPQARANQWTLLQVQRYFEEKLGELK